MSDPAFCLYCGKAPHGALSCEDAARQRVRVCKHGQLARSCERCDFDAVLAERDEAVAALRRFAEIDLRGTWLPEDFAWWVLRARAVLAKIEGGSDE